MVTAYFHEQKVKIEKVILSGASARLPGLGSYMAEKLNRQVFVGDPFSKIICPEILKPTLIKLAPSLAVATGAALRELV